MRPDFGFSECGYGGSYFRKGCGISSNRLDDMRADSCLDLGNIRLGSWIFAEGWWDVEEGGLYRQRQRYLSR